MIFIPFIFFSILFIHSYNRKGLDLGGVVSMMYVITSFCAILLYFSKPDELLDDYSSFSLSIVSTFVYCFFIGALLLPFISFNSNRKKNIALVKNIALFNKITYFYIGLFFLMIILLYNDIFNGILQQNLADMRQLAHENEIDTIYTRYSGVKKLLVYAAGTMSAGSNYMILFFFYSICFTNNKNLHNVLILLSSMSTIIGGIVDVDRSCVIKWLILLIIGFFLFKPYMNKETKRMLYKWGTVIFVIIGVYFFAVTIARFVLLDGGVGGGLLSYVGQPFLNFSNIWNNVEFTGVSTRRLFPAINEFLLQTDHERNNIIIKGSNFVRLNGFESIFGIFLMDFGRLGSCIVMLFFTVIVGKVCNRFRRKRIITIQDCFYLFVVANLAMYGSIAYIFAGYADTMNLFFMMFLVSRLSKSKVASQLV